LTLAPEFGYFSIQTRDHYQPREHSRSESMASNTTPYVGLSAGVLGVFDDLGLDPILVPWFQRRIGNGGAGLCVTGVVAELIVVGAGIALMPKGVL
jgi:hypothetical protein